MWYSTKNFAGLKFLGVEVSYSLILEGNFYFGELTLDRRDRGKISWLRLSYFRWEESPGPHHHLVPMQNKKLSLQDQGHQFRLGDSYKEYHFVGEYKERNFSNGFRWCFRSTTSPTSVQLMVPS